MKHYLSLLAFVAATFTSTVHAADCTASAAEKKLSGAAKISFMKKCEADNKAPVAMVDKATDAGPVSCETQADNRKLSGAARASFLRKCTRDTATH